MSSEESRTWHECGPALSFARDASSDCVVRGKSYEGVRARACRVRLPHGVVKTPVFMPVGTKGTIKGMTAREMASAPISCEILLGNTYHLADRPGTGVLEEAGGLHEFMQWNGNILTDSGGFQMVSLLKLAKITEEGVTFSSPVDGSPMLLTPEESIRTQHVIGSDICMVLDDVVHSCTEDRERHVVATARTVRWLDRCIKAHKTPALPNRGSKFQNIFAIVQGHLDVSEGGLRDQCLRDFAERDADIPGYAIGGLAGGESKDSFWRVVELCCRKLPADKPRYLMGVGYPTDLVVCTALGVDMYDCVYPTRTARFGTAMTKHGLMRLKLAQFAEDARPIEEGCECKACRVVRPDGTVSHYSRAFLRLQIIKKESLAATLLTHHNIAYMLGLVRSMRQAILDGRYPEYVRKFLSLYYPGGKDQIPAWAVDALAAAGIAV